MRRRKKVPLSRPIVFDGACHRHVIVKAPPVPMLLAINAIDDPILQHFSFIAAMTGISFLAATMIDPTDYAAILAATGEVV